MSKILKIIFFVVLVRPIVFLLLGLNVKHRERLPKKGPAIIIANHNSHLDTLILMSLFPTDMLQKIRPVAAADYFLKNRLISWFSQNIVGIIPVKRQRSAQHEDALQNVYEALAENNIVIFYPEGTRGEPEHLNKFRSGIARLAIRYPNLNIYPVYIYGTGKALPKGEALLVPFVVDIEVDEPVHFSGYKEEFMQDLEERYMRHLTSMEKRLG